VCKITGRLLHSRRPNKDIHENQLVTVAAHVPKPTLYRSSLQSLASNCPKRTTPPLRSLFHARKS
jgi:hypothetical protein